MKEVSGIKEKFIQRVMKKARGNRRPILKKIKHYKSILIISEDDKTHLVPDMLNTFKGAIIQTARLRKEKEDTSTIGNYTYSSHDFNLTGKLKNDKLNELFQTEFDLVLDLSNNGLLTNFIIEKLKASFIVGKQQNTSSLLHDLMVPSYEDETKFIDTIKQQITLLSQDGNK